MADNNLERALHAASIKMANTEPGRLISLADTRRLAADFNVSAREVELRALRQNIMPVRYQRNLGTLGVEGQIALLQACVAVVGAGGLGGYIIEGLARMGVGTLIIVDGDVFTEDNLNRQLGCTEKTLGMPKVNVLNERIRSVNGAVEVRMFHTLLTERNAFELLAGAQVAVDALDNLPDRLLLQKTAHEMGIPMVHGAIAGHTGQVMTILPGDAGLAGLYGKKPSVEQGIEKVTGNPAATPMLIAAWQIAMVVQILAGRIISRGCLFLFDTEYGECIQVSVENGSKS